MGRGSQGVASANSPVRRTGKAGAAASGKNADSARAPGEKPPFTVGDLKRAIPPHCFERSLFRSSAYLFIDFAFAALFFYATTRFDDIEQFVVPAVKPSLPDQIQPFLQPALSAGLWAAYIWLQGCVCTGLWVIAHECGHGAFSDYAFVNDAVGMFVHSWLLVPYFSWKYSHRRHHSNTGSMERDEVFVPKRREQLTVLSEWLQQPFGRLISIFITLTLGWPLYLSFNVSGRHYDDTANHFNPYSAIFSSRERFWILVSDLGLLAVSVCLYSLGSEFGLAWVLRVYVAPLLVVNMFLVLITLLQHTHPSLPHFDDSEWDWLRGALATVDRDYGFLNIVHHHIADTHVAHHIFSSMPHYHAEEATRAIKPILGDYYRFDGTPIVKALWREATECVFVSPDADGPKGVFWYTKKIK